MSGQEFWLRRRDDAREWFASVRSAGEGDGPVPAGSTAERWRRMSPEARQFTVEVFDDIWRALTEPCALPGHIGHTAVDCQLARHDPNKETPPVG